MLIYTYIYISLHFRISKLIQIWKKISKQYACFQPFLLWNNISTGGETTMWTVIIKWWKYLKVIVQHSEN